MLLSVPADFCFLMCFCLPWYDAVKTNTTVCLIFFVFVCLFCILSKHCTGWSSTLQTGRTNIHTQLEIHTSPSQMLSHWADQAALFKKLQLKAEEEFCKSKLDCRVAWAVTQWVVTVNKLVCTSVYCTVKTKCHKVSRSWNAILRTCWGAFQFRWPVVSDVLTISPLRNKQICTWKAAIPSNHALRTFLLLHLLTLFVRDSSVVFFTLENVKHKISMEQKNC